MVSIFKNGRLMAEFVSCSAAMCYGVQECVTEGDTVEVVDNRFTDPYMEVTTTFCYLGGKMLSWEDKYDFWAMEPLYAEPEVQGRRPHTRSYTGVTTDIKYARSEHRAEFGHSGGYACFKRRARRVSRYVGKELIREQMEAA